jgi:hypothetical protein
LADAGHGPVIDNVRVFMAIFLSLMPRDSELVHKGLTAGHL